MGASKNEKFLTFSTEFLKCFPKLVFKMWRPWKSSTHHAILMGQSERLKFSSFLLTQTWTYCSTILLGPISWPFFSINPKSFIGIGIVWSFTFWSFNFVTVLLLLVFKTLNIGLYKVYFWYCIGIVLLYANIYLGNSVSSKNSEHLKTKQF